MLSERLSEFTESNYAALCEKDITAIDMTQGKGIAMIAIPCKHGFLIGGWRNEKSDCYLAVKMLAFAMYCLIAVITVTTDSESAAIRSIISNDTRLGLDKRVAQNVIIRAAIS